MCACVVSVRVNVCASECESVSGHAHMRTCMKKRETVNKCV